MYKLTEIELNAFCSNTGGIYMNFAMAMSGAFVSFLISVLTAKMQPAAFAVFVSLTALTGILAVFFGVMDYVTRKNKASLA